MIQKIAVLILGLISFSLTASPVVKLVINWKEINKRYWGRNKGKPTQYLIIHIIKLVAITWFLLAVWGSIA